LRSREIAAKRSIDTQKAFGDEKNFFEMGLARGSSIRQVQFEPGETDADDDYVIFDLDFDREKFPRSDRGTNC
jgi:hypothetical protein